MDFHRTRRPLMALALATASLCVGRLAGAEELERPDVVEGRLTLSASYGFDAIFFRDDNASGLNPFWGHGVFLRVGGERCGRVCLGLSGLGLIGVSPESSGSVGVGPHLGIRWGGPSWAGAYNFRFGVAYYWHHTPQPSFDNGIIELGEGRGAHGVGAWLAFGLELLRRPGLLTPIIGIRARYAAAVSGDPVEHHLSAQVYLGVAIGRRLIFGEGPELELDDHEGPPIDDEPIELDEEEERILREAEDALRE